MVHNPKKCLAGRFRARVNYRPSGVTLVEVMFSVVIVLIAVLGTMRYRYYAGLSARAADIHVQATQTAELLLQSWGGAGGSETYDPLLDCSSVSTIVSSGSGPGAGSGFATLGKYKVTSSEGTFYVTLAWKDINTELRALNTIVAWDQYAHSEAYSDTDKTYRVTTYVNI